MKTPRLAVLLLAIAAPAVAQVPAPTPSPAEPTAPAQAKATATDPREIIQKAVDDVLAVLRDPALAQPARRTDRIEAIRTIVDRVFDWNAMARSSLGVHWRKLNDAQRKQFVATFRDVLAAEYVNDFDRFRGDEQVTIDQVQTSGDTRTVKTTVITHSREKVPVDYAMQRTPEGRWVVQDFSVEGISIVNHYRQSFQRYLTNHSFDELMQTLDRRRQVLRQTGPVGDDSGLPMN
jgi:phospholipid transport system substrate-binding protein